MGIHSCVSLKFYAYILNQKILTAKFSVRNFLSVSSVLKLITAPYKLLTSKFIILSTHFSLIQINRLKCPKKITSIKRLYIIKTEFCL